MQPLREREHVVGHGLLVLDHFALLHPLDDLHLQFLLKALLAVLALLLVHQFYILPLALDFLVQLKVLFLPVLALRGRGCQLLLCFLGFVRRRIEPI